MFFYNGYPNRNQEKTILTVFPNITQNNYTNVLNKRFPLADGTPIRLNS